jgi:hypothetical protein
MDDRNKTGLTHDVTNAVATWLDERGFKPVETEVCMPRARGESGWVADLAGVIDPTQTELIELKLLRRPPSWNKEHSTREGQKHSSWDSPTRAAWKAERRALRRPMTCLVEVKTSRADFVGDRKWLLPQPTDLVYLAIPSGLVKEAEYPAGWGILSYSEAGSIRQLRPPTPVAVDMEKRMEVILSVAVRRDHHTRYARFREFQKIERLEAGERKTLRRMSDLAGVFVQVIRGEHNSVDEILDRERIKNLSAYHRAHLDALWNTNPALEVANPYGRKARAPREKGAAPMRITGLSGDARDDPAPFLLQIAAMGVKNA